MMNRILNVFTVVLICVFLYFYYLQTNDVQGTDMCIRETGSQADGQTQPILIANTPLRKI